jgi:predicted nuclease of predicted toxin-antitoxin system
LKILLDESVPRLIKTSLPEFSISTVQEMGWTGLKNGDLLALAEKQFDVFITADRQLRHQQNLTGRRLSVIVLPTNQVPAVIALLPAIQQAIERIQRGAYEELTLPAS